MSNIKKEFANTKLQTFEYLVERGKIREFARAICDQNPVYFDVDYARSQGLSDLLMPVTFPANHMLQLNSENWVLEIMQKVNMDGSKAVHGSCELIHHRSVCAGETFRGEVWFGEIYEKLGKRGGAMTFMEMEVKFFDSDEKLAFSMRNVFIEKG